MRSCWASQSYKGTSATDSVLFSSIILSNTGLLKSYSMHIDGIPLVARLLNILYCIPFRSFPLSFLFLHSHFIYFIHSYSFELSLFQVRKRQVVRYEYVPLSPLSAHRLSNSYFAFIFSLFFHIFRFVFCIK